MPILNGFNHFNFSNTKEDYDNVKYLSFILICRYLPEAGNTFFNYISNFKTLLKSIVNLDYIDRIKALIAFISNYYDNLFKTKLVQKNEKIIKKVIGPIDDSLILVNLDDEDIIKKYSYIKKAFEIIYRIVDGLSEDCALYKIIQQFNSLILEETLTNSKKYSGTILNINDIKLELIQNINRFLFISNKDRQYIDCYSFFRDISFTVTINIRSIMCYFSNGLEYKISYNNLVIVIFFLLLHESLGHKKKNINNGDVDSPRTYYGIDFEDLSINNSDTGIILEKILFGRPFNPQYLMKNENPFIFLDEKLYLGKNFETLQIIYSKFEKDIENNLKNGPKIEEKEEEEVNLNKNFKLNFKKSGKEILKKNLNDEEEEKDSHLLFHDLFAIYGDLNEEERKKNENNLDYQMFLMMYKEKKQRKRYTIEDLK